MQKQNLSKNTAKCSKSSQRDFNSPLGGMTQDQSLLKTAGNRQNWQKSQEFTNLGMNVKNLREFESQHRSYHAQNISHLPKITELRTKHSDRRIEDISPHHPAESAQLLLESDRQLRGGGKSEEETSTKEVQDKHLTSLLHKIDE